MVAVPAGWRPVILVQLPSEIYSSCFLPVTLASLPSGVYCRVYVHLTQLPEEEMGFQADYGLQALIAREVRFGRGFSDLYAVLVLLLVLAVRH